MRFNIHIYHHGCLDAGLLEQIRKLLKPISNMATKADFDALRDEINASVANISDDITRLTDKLASGGLSAEEETQVFDEFRTVAENLKHVADRTPEDSEPEEPGTEV